MKSEDSEIPESADWRIVIGAVGFHIISAVFLANMAQLPRLPEGGLLWLLMPVFLIGGFVLAVLTIASLVAPPDQIKIKMAANGMKEASADRMAWRFWLIFLISCYLPAYLSSFFARG